MPAFVCAYVGVHPCEMRLSVDRVFRVELISLREKRASGLLVQSPRSPPAPPPVLLPAEPWDETGIQVCGLAGLSFPFKISLKPVFAREVKEGEQTTILSDRERKKYRNHINCNP